MMKIAKKYLTWIIPLLFLAGCSLGVLDSKGQVGKEEGALIITATLLMLIVVIPAIVMTFVFAWKYRENNEKSTYAPDWAHSVKIESFVWGVPFLIILILAIITWRSTHQLDPYKPLDSDVEPIVIEVVALDWKWLFIYPKYGIATVNHIEMPINVPIAFKITSDAPMNSFFIPRLGGQIYAMSGMQTQLHLIANEKGTFRGLSANISGQGFSDMTFTATATSDKDFKDWVNSVRQSQLRLDKVQYNKLSNKSENHPIQYFSYVEPRLFEAVIEKYMMPGKQDADRKFIIRQD
ncbi:ubiquinol oxidase subunit II [Shewanella surugensis]|uniref:Ubiquinol oxidase subunit 2 n=1 Tax=Shewanella surugensis TaxID=212020 RepID=A0ABT0LC43_9GAMM|nr:ubiquinol oxidase subunit II [Shewanella surugensis]MCL1125261.1 ubiquinol oxidase subunit II [Shewanella surugensis]